MAKQWGSADFKFLDIPHPIANLSEPELDLRVENLIDEVRHLFLTGQPG